MIRGRDGETERRRDGVEGNRRGGGNRAVLHGQSKHSNDDNADPNAELAKRPGNFIGDREARNVRR